MKKLTISLSDSEFHGLAEWLSVYTEALIENSQTYAEKCVTATLVEWYYSKVAIKQHYRHEKKVTLKLNSATAMALAEAIRLYNPQAFVFVGNLLLKLSANIDQHFK